MGDKIFLVSHSFFTYIGIHIIHHRIVMNLGYACINMTLGKKKITTNRSMIKKTFLQRGINYAAELGLQNVKDLETIIHWNVENNIKLFRISSDMFPWASEYGIENLPNIDEISEVMKRTGEYAKRNGVRLGCHPGPFNVLCSPNEKVVQNTIIDLENHGKVLDLLGLSHTPYNKINIHCNGTYGDKIASMQRFCDNYDRLSESVKSRLTVENDDKASMYSVKDLMYIHERTGIPIVFDYHHHTFNTGGLTEQEALELAMSTWPDGITPVVHYSSSKPKESGNPKDKPQAHADYILEKINTYSHNVDVMLECKAKELALLEYRKQNGEIQNG
jgi:UV DNA damage endonuclease